MTSNTIEVTWTNLQEVYFQHLGTSHSSDICFARYVDDLDEHFCSNIEPLLIFNC